MVLTLNSLEKDQFNLMYDKNEKNKISRSYLLVEREKSRYYDIICMQSDVFLWNSSNNPKLLITQFQNTSDKINITALYFR